MLNKIAPFKSEKQRRYLWLKHPDIAKRWTKEYGSKPIPSKKKKKRKKTKAEYRAAITRIASLHKQGLLGGDNAMNLQDIRGFRNYTPEVITELRHMFGDEEINSRPIIINDAVIWVDGDEKMHRDNGPAVERSNGTTENWNHGKRIR